MNSTNQIKGGFFLKLKLLSQLIAERVKSISNKNKKSQEIALSFSLIVDFIKKTFTVQEKLVFLISIFLFFLIISQIISFFSFASIDKALQNQQSAKAENLIKTKNIFIPNNKSLKLRLAHAYLGLEREEEARIIIQEIQAQEPYNPYLPKVAIALADNLKRKQKAEQAINILEKLPLTNCQNCKQSLLELYTMEGRRALIERNLERATFFLSKALILAEKLHESSSSLGHRKRELARAYNLQAMSFIKAKELDRAINVLERSGSIYAQGQTYLELGKLYHKRQANTEDLKKALTYYEKAYSFGQTEPENILNYNQILRALKTKLQANKLSPEEIEKILKSFSLPENINRLASEPKDNSNNKNTTSNQTQEDKKPKEEPKLEENSIPAEQITPIQEPLLEEESE